MKSKFEIRVLKRGVELLGSAQALSLHLDVPLPDLVLWLNGSDRPTKAKFQAAVDLLVKREDKEGLAQLHSLAFEQTNILPGTGHAKC